MVIRTVMIIFILFVFDSEALYSYGVRAAIVLKNGETIVGEVIAVRGDSLLLSKNIWHTEEKLMKELDGMRVIRRDDIQEFILKGESHVAEGIGMGLMAGFCVGILMAFDPGGGIPFSGGLDQVSHTEGALIAMPLIGVGLGTITGITTSTHDMKLKAEIVKNFKFLNQFSRYRDEIPDYLMVFFK